MRGINDVARAVRGIFGQQRTQYRTSGRERFGSWDRKLATALRDAVARLYLTAAKGAKAKAEHADAFASLARERAEVVARQVNATTAEWLAEGRELREVWGPERVARIAAAEALYARSAGVTLLAERSKQRLRWHANVGCCDACRKWNGRTVKAGKPFGVVNGEAVYHPGLHPFCRCEVQVV